MSPKCLLTGFMNYYLLLLILFSSSKLDKDDILQYIYFKQYHAHHSSRTTHQTASYTNHIVRSGKFKSAF